MKNTPAAGTTLINISTGTAYEPNGVIGKISDHQFRLLARILDQERSDSSLHSLEVEEAKKKAIESYHRDSLSQKDLRVELEKQYGCGVWARRLIRSILSERLSLADISFSFA